MAAWTSGNGVANSRTFDQDYRVTDIEISGAGMLHDLAYGYNVVDNITTLTDGLNASLSQTFDYDVLDRLSDADGDYGDQSYTYDANGNRTERDNATTLVTQTLTYTTGTNQLATEDSQAVVHDSAGNRTSDNGGTRTYAYNHAGRMTQFTESSVVQADYTYNAQGQRIRKVLHDGASDYVRHFFYDQAGRLIGEYRDNPDGSYAYIDYVWLNDSPLVQEARSFNSSDVLTSTQTTWLHVDHLNTPRVGTDDSQTIVWRWDSDPFGVGDADADPDNDSTDHVVLLRFPGQYEDEDSRHFYNYFRDYDPATGRYAQSDPIGLSGGLNTYAYVDGKPTNHVDPLGLFKCYVGMEWSWSQWRCVLSDNPRGTTPSYNPSGMAAVYPESVNSANPQSCISGCEDPVTIHWTSLSAPTTTRKYSLQCLVSLGFNEAVTTVEQNVVANVAKGPGAVFLENAGLSRAAGVARGAGAVVASLPGTVVGLAYSAASVFESCICE